MGKKYVVEIGRLERLYKASTSANGKPNMTWLSPEVDLTPYTEPDLERVKKTAHDDGYSEGYQAGRGELNRVLSDVESDVEQVRKEAYEDGYKTAKVQCNIQAEKDLREVGERHYQNGLSDAWEAVRKVIHMPEADLFNLFTECYSAVCTPLQVFLKYDASEAIEKIRQYEQEKEFKVGDEFENESGKKFVVLKMNGKEIDRYIDVDGKTYCMTVKYKEMRKTGRHFPEIAAVLEKMRGEQDG